MNISIDDKLIALAAEEAARRAAAETVAQLFKSKENWNGSPDGSGRRIVRETLEAYVKTQDFQDMVLATAKELTLPIVRDVVKDFITRATKEELKRSTERTVG